MCVYVYTCISLKSLFVALIRQHVAKYCCACGVCVYVCRCVSVYACMHVYVYTCICVYVYTCICAPSVRVYVYTCICVYTYKRVYVYTCICVYTYKRVYVYTCICVYTYTRVYVYMSTSGALLHIYVAVFGYNEGMCVYVYACMRVY